MTHRIVVNIQTGEATQVNLTAEEVAQAQAMKAAWDAEQTAKQSTPTLEETIQSQAATINALTARIVALEQA